MVFRRKSGQVIAVLRQRRPLQGIADSCLSPRRNRRRINGQEAPQTLNSQSALRAGSASCATSARTARSALECGREAAAFPASRPPIIWETKAAASRPHSKTLRDSSAASADHRFFGPRLFPGRRRTLTFGRACRRRVARNTSGNLQNHLPSARFFQPRRRRIALEWRTHKGGAGSARRRWPQPAVLSITTATYWLTSM
jgi:hypothetical protein